ncbi:hypothetical protein [Fimbriiglobus ruber]|uniref:Uncharacterized protein n=1 Tax=Fimbriiglobus ruber TaxID=1908690 RepID=A0A225DTZ9_9BACT|nr:hypothetical protein [Fimbriiglobus ruber]OWK41076.1 hypothetical protein FRUB_04968 [Fimbriiglobus ruber]
MAPGLTLTGRLEATGAPASRTEIRDGLARAAAWFETLGDVVLGAELGHDADNRPVLFVSFHPAADDVELRLSSGGLLRATATTAPAGPGYHTHLCRALGAFAEDFGVAWERIDDPTGFFPAGDPDALNRQFLAHARRRCRAILDAPDEPGPAILGLPPDHGFTHPGPILTPCGPRSREWAAAVAADPAAARDMFPWWHADPDAGFYRNRAIALLWCEFPWRAPLTEEEGELTDQIAADLEEAFALDPTAPLPWRAWADVFVAIEADRNGFTVQGSDAELKAEVRRRAAAQPPCAAPVGYRRFPVRVALGDGWSVLVPGSLADGWADDGQTWLAWDDRRTVTIRPAGPGAARELTVEECRDARGQQVWRLAGIVSVGGAGLRCQIDVADPADKDWAADVWQSVCRHPAEENRSVTWRAS